MNQLKVSTRLMLLMGLMAVLLISIGSFGLYGTRPALTASAPRKLPYVGAARPSRREVAAINRDEWARF